MKLVKWFGTFTLASVISISAFISTSEASAYDDFNRISGEDRYETSIKVSRNGWGYHSTNYVILAVGNNYPDALAGAPLSKKLNAPILLTKNDSIPSSVLSEIGRLGAKNAIILGGSGAISENVVNQLKAAGVASERLAGDNRYETSAMIAEKVGGTTAVVASGKSFADSLAIASYAAEKGMPILLTAPDQLSPEVAAVAKNYDNSIIVGGKSVVSSTVYYTLQAYGSVNRVSGNDRYETAANVVSKLYPSTVGASLVASGQNYADALTGSALGAKRGQPVLLVRQSSLPSPTKSIIQEKNINELTVIGGEGAVTPEALNPNPTPPPTTKPVSAPAPAVDVRKQIIDEAYKYMGVRYLYGGTTTNGFDCSGYIQYVFNKEGISLPRTTGGLATAGKAVSYANAKPGDVIVLALNSYKPGVPSHAGIYLGNGKMIHAGTSKGVSEFTMTWENWDKKIVTVRSFVN